MTSSKRPKIVTPEEVAPDSPSPTPIPGREEEEAKKKTRKMAGGSGRAQNILAGRLTADRGNVLNTKLG